MTEAKVRTLNKPGKYADGGNGLYLRIVETAGGDIAKSWVFRYRFPRHTKGGGKQRDMGLGTPARFDLATARGIVREYWQMIERGQDPMEHRRALASGESSVRAAKHTYKDAADKFIGAKRAGWHPRHAKAWDRGLANYCGPIANLPVDAITADDVAKCLAPNWLKKPETTDHVRQQIERVLDAAAADGWRSKENPARWKGSMEAKLPDRPRGLKSTPRAALPYADAPAFVAELRKRGHLSTTALEFQILTAVRPGEASGARWEEMDLDAARWTIPGGRMKMGEEHVVPLSSRAVALLRALPRTQQSGGFVFFGFKKGQPMTTAAPMKWVKELRPGLTAHGFRSTFRTWCAEIERCPRDIAEAALAHAIEGVEGIYNRAEHLAARAKVMQDWADYLDGKARGESEDRGTTKEKPHG
ncbi:MAG: tyrosine-type recombinase/integrase [Rhodanobacteraceae bacterium]